MKNEKFVRILVLILWKNSVRAFLDRADLEMVRLECIVVMQKPAYVPEYKRGLSDRKAGRALKRKLGMIKRSAFEPGALNAGG